MECDTFEKLEERLREDGCSFKMCPTDVKRIRITRDAMTIGGLRVNPGDEFVVLAINHGQRGRNGYWCQADTTEGYALFINGEFEVVEEGE